ncbi:MAG: hypothetical protein MZV70_54755 [Desulfobacterales bacterium]|nr:hypothetical protein [Desulfobacterales bacterium]
METRLPLLEEPESADELSGSLPDRLTIVCYPSGTTVKQLGEVEKVLNFIVSGELKESNYRMIEDQQVKFKKPIQLLKAERYFWRRLSLF